MSTLPEADGRSLDARSHWNNLRTIGNSTIAKASIAVPVLGYLIMFQENVIEFLKMSSSFCAGCHISWRLHFLYFGACFFAMASLVYAWRCPLLIKRYGSAPAYFDAEKLYYSHAKNMQFLFSLLQHERGVQESDNLSLHRLQEADSAREGQSHLAGLMGEYYYHQNRKWPNSRKTVFVLYFVGGALLAIPTVVTFLQVLAGFSRQSL